MPSEMGSRNNSYRDNSQMPARIIIVCDATKDRNDHEFIKTIGNILKQGLFTNPGDTIVVLGVLHKVLHPMGYQMGVAPANFLGTTHTRALEEDISKKVDMYVRMLLSSAEECEENGVDIEVNITAGTPMRKVVINQVEVNYSNVAWVILDRHLRREMKYYLKHLQCKVALVHDNFVLEVVRHSNTDKEIDNVGEKTYYYTVCRSVSQQIVSDDEIHEHSSITGGDNAPMSSIESSLSSSCTYDSKAHNLQDGLVLNHRKGESGNCAKLDAVHYASTPKQRRKSNRRRCSDTPVLCIACGLKTEVDLKRYNYADIERATDNFSSANLLGEGGFGLVYKGKLDEQLIAAKVRKETSTQGFAEFNSEVFVLSVARHKNIVMLLGYCCKENLNILVYEYICNKSLDWHLFHNPDHVLDWHRRQAIAIGTARGLRFLHEECRGSPIIHRDMRPSNILLTHDFVAMLGDFGLAKWKTSEDEIQTRILGTLGYLAPEYAENGIVSMLTDVYSFGIVLIQLISGRKAVDYSREGQQPSLRQWALPLIESLALHELVDPRLGDSYNTYQMYNMARTAYLCVQTNPEMRPSMAEVLRFLEGESDHFHHLTEQFIPHYSN